MTAYVFMAKAPQRGDASDAELTESARLVAAALADDPVLHNASVDWVREPVTAIRMAAHVHADGREKLARVLIADASADTLKRALRDAGLRDVLTDGHMKVRGS